MCTNVLQRSDFPHIDHFKCSQVSNIEYLKCIFFSLRVACMCVHVCVYTTCWCLKHVSSLSGHLTVHLRV